MSQAGRFPERKQRGRARDLEIFPCQNEILPVIRRFGGPHDSWGPKVQLCLESPLAPDMDLGRKLKFFRALFLSAISAVSVALARWGLLSHARPAESLPSWADASSVGISQPFSWLALQPPRQICQVSLYLPPLRVSFATGGPSPAKDFASSQGRSMPDPSFGRCRCSAPC